MSERDWRIAAILFALISSVYFATIAGITSSNDGSHYALVRALVDKHIFEISEYMEFTEHQDYALHGGLRFSDRPPGTAILTAPVYALSALLPKPLVMINSKHDAENPRVIYAMIAPVVAAAATATILYWLLRAHFGLSSWASVLTTVALALGTISWKYGSLLYSHATSGLVVIATTMLMLRWGGRETRWRNHFLVGLLLGASVLLEYTNVVFVAVAGVWWVWAALSPRPPTAPPVQGGRGKGLLVFLLGGFIPAAFLMWYNTTNFGSPFAISTFHADTIRWPQNASFLADFATPLWVGLPAMLLWGSDNQGLFWLAPISLLGLLGLGPLWQKSRREFFLIVGAFVAMLLLFSASTTFNPNTNDGRYITPFLGLWFVAVGFGLTQFARADGRPPLQMAILHGLLFLSIRNQIVHIAFSWGHDLNPASLRPWATAPENIAAVWNAVFPNALNLPLWWGMAGAGWFVYRLTRSRLQSALTEVRADT